MIIYIGLILGIICIGTACRINGRNSNKDLVFIIFVFCMMFAIQALRAESIGEDTPAYIAWFQDYCNLDQVNSLFHPWRDIEIGYSTLNVILSRFTNNPRILITIVSLIIISLHLYFIIKNSKNPFLSILLFMGLNYFITSMVSWRQFIAMGIVFWAFPFLLNKKYIKASCIMILAFAFHDTSALFSITLIGVVLLSKNYMSSFIILIGGTVSLFFINHLLNLVLTLFPAYKIYFGYDSNFGQIRSIGKLSYIYILVELILISIVLCLKKYHTPKIIGMSSLMALSVIVKLLGLYIPHMFRIGYFFDYFLILLIPELISDTRNGQIIKVSTFAASLLLYFYYLSTNPGQTVPYAFYF